LRKTKNADRLGSREPAREGGGGVRERRLFNKRMVVERGNRPCARPRHLERDRRLPRLVGKKQRPTNREGDPPGLERREHKAKRNPRPEADLGRPRLIAGVRHGRGACHRWLARARTIPSRQLFEPQEDLGLASRPELPLAQSLILPPSCSLRPTTVVPRETREEPLRSLEPPHLQLQRAGRRAATPRCPRPIDLRWRRCGVTQPPARVGSAEAPR